MLYLTFRTIPGVLGRTAFGARFLMFTPPFRNQEIVGRTTDLCIEGAPRSANVFSKTVTWLGNPGLSIAGETHQPGNFLLAVKAGIPCVILVRDPVPALVSWMEFSSVGEPARRLLLDYARFYECVIDNALRGRVVICRFEDVTASPQAITRMANSALGTDFNHCKESMERSRELAFRHRHRLVRGTLAPADRKDLEAGLRSSRHFGRARDAYERVSAMAAPQAG